MGQTSCILLGLECQRVAYVQWNEYDGTFFPSLMALAPTSLL